MDSRGLANKKLTKIQLTGNFTTINNEEILKKIILLT
jgi:hypothetical protein